MTQDPQEDNTVYFYGKTIFGNKFHTGHEVDEFPSDNGEFMVRTHCGNRIIQMDEGQRPPHLGEDEDLCKVCHRSYAWEVMKDSLHNRHEVEEQLARHLDELAQQVEDNILNDVGVVRELRGYASNLRNGVSGVPAKKTKKGNLRLVSNGG